MKRALVVAAVLAPLARPALAGSCGGSSGGSSSSSSGSSGGGGSSSSGSSSGGTTRMCEDASDIVGYRHCTPYGAWGNRLPHLIIELGVAVRQFESGLGNQASTVTHGNETFSYRTVMAGASGELDTAVVSTMRIGIALRHGFYVASDIELGGLTTPAPASVAMESTGTFGSPRMQQQHGIVIDTLGTIGFRGATHHGSLGVELAGGLRTVQYNFHSVYHDCDQSTAIHDTAPLLEARARGELWLTPWITAGVTVGSSVIDRGSWMGGVYVGVHTRSFGGDR